MADGVLPEPVAGATRILVKKHKKIVSSLAAASSLLIGGAAFAESSVIDDKSDILGWDLKSSSLYYTEPDRVHAIETILNGRYQINSEEYFNLKLTADVLTGASANGAVPSIEPLTYTRPSGEGTYRVKQNKIPLDDTFMDIRAAVGGLWSKQVSRAGNIKLGGNFSYEYDYISVGGSSTYSHSLNKKNTTLSAGVAVAHDTLDPEGGVPTVYGRMRGSGETPDRIDSQDTKTTVDLLLGLTQVVTPTSFLVLNYGLSHSDGYHTDPFKVISVVDERGRVVVADIQRRLPLAIYENRPNSRLKQNLFLLYKANVFNADVLDLSYRYMFDDWEIDSHTVDLRYKFRLTEKSYLRPHLRFYYQDEAEFFTPFFVLGSAPTRGDTSVKASADYRLAELFSYTVGLEFGRDNVSIPWSVAVEWYLQAPEEPDNKFGELNRQTLLQDLDAIIFRLNVDI